jgi:hypothetical protein
MNQRKSVQTVPIVAPVLTPATSTPSRGGRGGRGRGGPPRTSTRGPYIPTQVDPNIVGSSPRTRRPYIPNVNVNISLPNEGISNSGRTFVPRNRGQGPVTDRSYVPRQHGAGQRFTQQSQLQPLFPAQVAAEATGTGTGTDAPVRKSIPREEKDPEFIVTKNGAIAIRNIQRQPVVLYVQMWEALRDAITSEAFTQFIADNEQTLKRFPTHEKEEEEQEQEQEEN